MKHLFREYVNRVAVAECGAKVRDRDWTVKACDITCPKCKRTSAFRQAAKNPFWGVSLEKKAKKKPVQEEDLSDLYPEDDVNTNDFYPDKEASDADGPDVAVSDDMGDQGDAPEGEGR